MTNPLAFDSLGAALLGDRCCAIVYAGESGEIGFWNAGAERLFGHSIAEISGKRIDIIVPAEYRERHWAGFYRVMGSSWRGSEGWGPIEALHKDGSRIALEVFLTPVHHDEDRVKGVLAMFRVAEQA